MKNTKKILTVLVLTVITTLFSSCYSPNPLYGKWADNSGNTITFNPDLTFTAKIYYNGTSSDYDGAISVIENVLSISKSDGTISVTEWDIRGSILYLTWATATGNEVSLQLYHTAK